MEHFKNIFCFLNFSGGGVMSICRPRFFYGLVEKELGDKRGYVFCLVDTSSGLFAWFNRPYELGQAIAALIGKVASERKEYKISLLPRKRETSEIILEDQEDVLNWVDSLADRGAEKDYFFHEKGRIFFPGLEYQAVSEVVDNIEPEDCYFGPFFCEGDFTNDPNTLPAEISSMYKFIDLNAVQAIFTVMNEEVRKALHPEEINSINRRNGWTGVSDPSPVMPMLD